MSFISLEFVLLFLLCFTLYHFISDKGRKLVLLAASGVFIGYFNPAFLVTALVVLQILRHMTDDIHGEVRIVFQPSEENALCRPQWLRFRLFRL